MPADLVFKTLLHSADDDAAMSDDEPQHPVAALFKAAESQIDAAALERERLQADYDFRKRHARWNEKPPAPKPREDSRLEKRHVPSYMERPAPLRVETELQKNGVKVTRHYGVDDALLAVFHTSPDEPEYDEL
jgi:hypothetical protein